MRTKVSDKRGLQLRVLRLGLLQDGNVRIGFFLACEETFLLRQTHALQQVGVAWVGTQKVHNADSFDV